MPRDAADMSVICTAASAKHLELWQSVDEGSMERAELLGVAGVEQFGLVEFSMTKPAGVGADAADPLQPVAR